MNENKEILEQDYTYDVEEKSVSNTFSPEVKEQLQTLGYRNLTAVTLTEDTNDEKRRNILIYGYMTPYSYFPETEKVIHNAELDNSSHQERYTFLWDKISEFNVVKECTLQSGLYLLSADKMIYQIARNYVFEHGIDFQSFWNSAFLDSLSYTQKIFLQVVEKIYFSENSSVSKSDIEELDKDKIILIYEAMMIANGKVIDISVCLEPDKEVA